MAVIEERDLKIEKLTSNFEDIRKQNGKLFEENSRLEEMNEDLKLKNLELQRQCDELTTENIRLVTDSARAQERYDALEKEKDGLNSLTSQLSEQLGLRKRDVFGASTEQTSRLFKDNGELEDPLSEDTEPDMELDEKPQKLPKSRSAKQAMDLLRTYSNRNLRNFGPNA